MNIEPVEIHHILMPSVPSFETSMHSELASTPFHLYPAEHPATPVILEGPYAEAFSSLKHLALEDMLLGLLIPVAREGIQSTSLRTKEFYNSD